MKKVLMLASVASMINQFNMPNIYLLQQMGFEVHVACNFKEGSTCSDEKVELIKQDLQQLNITYYQVDFSRSVYRLDRAVKAYYQVVQILRENQYEFIHCHSPIGGMIGRLAGHRTGTKVMYTAHGFHFFHGAPKRYWAFIYPIEKYCSKYTDILITINQEDYKRAQRKFHAKRTEYIPGVGIDLEKLNQIQVDKKEKRKELGIPENAFVIFSIGEINKNKNHETIVRAVAETGLQDIYYVICGKGNEAGHVKELAQELHIEDRVKLLGFRTDAKQLCHCADIFAFPSQREGLGLSALEAMAAGLPLITSNVHGINDYSINGKSGYSCAPKDAHGFAEAIRKLYHSPEDRERMGQFNKEQVKRFDIHCVDVIMRKLYSEI